MPFVIIGYDRQRLISRTRVNPAGAIVLAKRWVDMGFTDVRIECDGSSAEPAEFSRRFMLTRNGMRPRSAQHLAVNEHGASK